MAVPITPPPGQHDHILITRFSLGRPCGGAVLCHLRCDQDLIFKQTQSGVRLECPKCKSRCAIPQFMTSRTTVLGRKGLVAVAYPPAQYPTEWRLPPGGTPNATPPIRDATTSRAIHPLPRQVGPRLEVPVPPDTMVRSVSLPSLAAETPSRAIRPLPRQVGPRLTVPTPPPNTIMRSTSLPPASTTAAPPPSNPPLRIRIPARPRTQAPPPAGPSRAVGSRESTATPPPPTPQEPPKHRKRTFAELRSAISERRQRTKEDEI